MHILTICNTVQDIYHARLYAGTENKAIAQPYIQYCKNNLSQIRSLWASDSSSVKQKYIPCLTILEDFLKIQKDMKCQNIIRFTSTCKFCCVKLKRYTLQQH